MPEIALAEYERANERDKPGWLLLNEEINKWLSRPGYSIRDKYDNGLQEPSMVEWSWLMLFSRFERTVKALLEPAYLFSSEACLKLESILKEDKRYQNGESFYFDHCSLPLSELRAHAFQGCPMESYSITWLASFNKADGLTVIAKVTVYAVARGYTEIVEGKRKICVDAVGLFIHDGFEFSGDQWLGRWSCKDKAVYAFFWGEELGNINFREFRRRTGYGCDFRTMNNPEIYNVKRFCYYASL